LPSRRVPTQLIMCLIIISNMILRLRYNANMYCRRTNTYRADTASDKTKLDKLRDACHELVCYHELDYGEHGGEDMLSISRDIQKWFRGNDEVQIKHIAERIALCSDIFK
jgi:hypothetical protein